MIKRFSEKPGSFQWGKGKLQQTEAWNLDIERTVRHLPTKLEENTGESYIDIDYLLAMTPNTGNKTKN